MGWVPAKDRGKKWCTPLPDLAQKTSCMFPCSLCLYLLPHLTASCQCPRQRWKTHAEDARASVILGPWMMAWSKGFPTPASPHTPRYSSPQPPPTNWSLCQQNTNYCVKQLKFRSLSVSSRGILPQKVMKLQFWDPPHFHGPHLRTCRNFWQWVHVIIFFFSLEFAEVKCFSYSGQDHVPFPLWFVLHYTSFCLQWHWSGQGHFWNLVKGSLFWN